MASITSNVPWFYNDGIKDTSRQPAAPEAAQTPSFYIRGFGFSRKGPVNKPITGSLDKLMAIFGDDTFSLSSRYATHQTLALRTAGRNGTAISFTRLAPDDAPAPASVRISIDVLKTSVPKYKRMADGNYELDNLGNRIEEGTIQGRYYKFVATPATGADNKQNIGAATIGNGSILDPSGSGAVSKRIPLIDLAMDDIGGDGQNWALSIWNDTASGTYTPINETLLSDMGCYPSRLSLSYRTSIKDLAQIHETTFGSSHIDFCLKPNAVHPVTEQRMYLVDQYYDAYQQLDSSGRVQYAAPIPVMHIYQDYIDALLQEIYEEEAAIEDPMTDFLATDDGDNKYRVNLFGAMTSKATPYHTMLYANSDIDVDTDINMARNSRIFLKGGGDGTISNEMFEKLVRAAMERYTSMTLPESSMALYPERIVIDTGFSTETKKTFPKVFSTRKDMMVGLATFVAGKPRLTAEEEAAMAGMLQTYLSNYPESTLYNTPCCRGFVVTQCGRYNDSTYNISGGDASVIISVVDKLSKYCGASNGKWLGENDPEGWPANKLTDFRDLNVDFVPFTLKSKLWSTGVIWAEPKDTESYFIPVLRSAYKYDNSVITGILPVLAACDMTKIAFDIATELWGISKLTQTEIASRFDNTFIERTADKFDSRFSIRPESTVTVADAQRLSTITSHIYLGGNGMFTGLDFGIITERKSE